MGSRRAATASEISPIEQEAEGTERGEGDKGSEGEPALLLPLDRSLATAEGTSGCLDNVTGVVLPGGNTFGRVGQALRLLGARRVRHVGRVGRSSDEHALTGPAGPHRPEEHTSELQSRPH